MPLLQQYIKQVWFGLITNTNCASSFDSYHIHTQLHLFVLQHLPEIQRMQFTCTIAPITVKRAPFPCSCAIVLACRNAIANYHILAETKYKPKQTTSTKTEHKPKPPHAHYQLLTAHTNKHVWTINCSCSWRHAPIAGEEGSPSPLQSIAEGRARGRRDIWAQGTED